MYTSIFTCVRIYIDVVCKCKFSCQVKINQLKNNHEHERSQSGRKQEVNEEASIL